MNDLLKQPPKIGMGVLVIKEGKVLLGQRRGAHGEGSWAPPGGHLDHGETLKECACRELREETGLIAHKMHLGPWTDELVDKSRHYITLFTFVTHFSGQPELLEPHKCTGWHWFAWDQLPSPLFVIFDALLQEWGSKRLQQWAAS